MGIASLIARYLEMEQSSAGDRAAVVGLRLQRCHPRSVGGTMRGNVHT